MTSVLSKSINTNTGLLDLSKFSQTLKAGNYDLASFGKRLQQIGPEGSRAFLSLSKAIAQSEAPLIRSNALMEKLWTTMQNTVRWQITAGLLTGFTSGISDAYRYAQDLNESLNNIRIVTGKSSDEMAKFAIQANKAAKELNTTTTKYTDASLIYYQQGLSDQEVKARTDVTTKFANVSRENLTTSSEYLTAIWNNFAKGSKNLEYFADVVVALGAATASSSQEIATGLNKFAATAETVGLSYEYATSALATVTATTRQSADVVGTAFKTLFSRIQDLELGKTLDDGTTLGKYSKALDAVGISIKDSNGELRDMDDILDDTGDKWQTLSKDQQVALAQAVGGVRQYTQFIALMDNWDFMKKNLETAKNATGEL
nr:MAG TPA: minor tail protein [Caudoviricetes sp.]